MSGASPSIRTEHLAQQLNFQCIRKASRSLPIGAWFASRIAAGGSKSCSLWGQTMALAEPKTSLELAVERTDLGLDRTLMAAERTLMAWIRTSLSMIGFGFTIYKFFQYLPEELASGNIRRPYAPRNLGLTLIALGTLALAAAAWQHRKFLKQIGASQARHVWSVSFVVAMAVVLIGVVAFYGVLLRHGPF